MALSSFAHIVGVDVRTRDMNSELWGRRGQASGVEG